MKTIPLTRRAFLLGTVSKDKNPISDKAGASAVEYGLIGGIVALALIAAMPKLAKRQRQNYRCVKRAMRGKKPNKFCKRQGA